MKTQATLTHAVLCVRTLETFLSVSFLVPCSTTRSPIKVTVLSTFSDMQEYPRTEEVRVFRGGCDGEEGHLKYSG